MDFDEDPALMEHEGGDPMDDIVGEDEEQPQGDEEEMMEVEDMPVTQEDAWAVIR